MNDPKIDFDTDSYPLIVNSGSSSMGTPFEADFIEGSHKELTCMTISGVASGLTASDTGSASCKIKDNKKNLIDLKIDKVLHLKKLPTRL